LSIAFHQNYLIIKIIIFMGNMNSDYFENKNDINKSFLNVIFPNKREPIIWDN
jgi:hypothetical protein